MFSTTIPTSTRYDEWICLVVISNLCNIVCILLLHRTLSIYLHVFIYYLGYCIYVAAIFRLTLGFHCYFSIFHLNLYKIMPRLRLAEKAIEISLFSWYYNYSTICNADKKYLFCWLAVRENQLHAIQYMQCLCLFYQKFKSFSGLKA